MPSGSRQEKYTNTTVVPAAVFIVCMYGGLEPVLRPDLVWKSAQDERQSLDDQAEAHDRKPSQVTSYRGSTHP
jgi:hypothetical protein